MNTTLLRATDRRVQLALFAFVGFLFAAYRTFYWKDTLREEYIQVILNVLGDTGIVYLLYLLMDPLSKRLRSRGLLFFVIWFLLGLVGSNLAILFHYSVHQLTGTLNGVFKETFNSLSFQIFDAYVVLFVGLGITTAFRWYHAWSSATLRLGELEKEKAFTELEYLKSQINPHFVFNTLNSIYFLIEPENDQARGALHTFSQMLRYQLYDSSCEQVPVEKEMEYIRNYITLQSLRLENGYRVTADLEENLAGFNIPPLLLIILVENAFKHLSHHSHIMNTVHVQASCREKQIIFHCENSCSPQERPKEIGGIGLKNLKRRLELIYAGSARLDVIQEGNRYSVTLSLPV